MRRIDRGSWPKWARVVSSGWVVSPLVLVIVLVVAFEGYGFYTRHQKTTYNRGGAFDAGGNLKTTNQPGTRGKKALHKGKGRAVSSHRGHTGGSGAGGGSFGSSLAAAGGSDRSGNGVRAGQSSRHASRSAPPTSGGSSPSAPQLVTPTSGVYGLTVSGYEQPKFGPFSACKNQFPTHATLDVHPASGEKGKSFDFDIRLYPGQPNKHDERHIYRYSSDAVTQTYEQETVTCSGMKQSTEVSFSPPQTRVELPLRVGASWRDHGGNSTRTETGKGKVVGRSSMTVQGKSYAVYEIKTHLKMSGSETGTRDQTWWYAPDLGLPLKWTEVLSGHRSGANYTEQLSVTVSSLPR